MGHTQGPWTIKASRVGGDIAVVQSGSSNIVAECFHDIRFSGESSGETLENAKLISASPQMLEVLQEIVAAYSAHEDGFARQVLRKHSDDAKAILAIVEVAA